MKTKIDPARPGKIKYQSNYNAYRNSWLRAQGTTPAWWCRKNVFTKTKYCDHTKSYALSYLLSKED